MLDWEDNRTASIVMGNTNYTSCNLFCSSIPTQVRNAANQPACCDGVFIPSVREFFVKLRRPLLVKDSRLPHRLQPKAVQILQAISQNVVGFDDQTLPYQYQILLTSETGVLFYTEIQGTWTINFNYAVCAQTHATLISCTASRVNQHAFTMRDGN